MYQFLQAQDLGHIFGWWFYRVYVASQGSAKFSCALERGRVWQQEPPLEGETLNTECELGRRSIHPHCLHKRMVCLWCADVGGPLDLLVSTLLIWLLLQGGPTCYDMIMESKLRCAEDWWLWATSSLCTLIISHANKLQFSDFIYLCCRCLQKANSCLLIKVPFL